MAGSIRFFLPGLTENATDENIRAHFSKYGNLTEAVAARNPQGQARGFGYLTYTPAIIPDPLLNDVHEIAGDDVRVVLTKEALAGTEVKKVHLSNCTHLSADEIRFAFSSFGQVWDVHTPKDPNTGERKFFAFVCFGNDEAYEKALAAGELEVGETKIVIKPAQQSPGDAGKGKGKGGDPWGSWDAWGWGPTGKGPGAKAAVPEEGIRYFVSNVPSLATEEDLVAHFGNYGKVIGASILKDRSTDTSKGLAYVTMEDASSRDTIVADTHTLAGQQLSIMLSKENLANANIEKVHVDGCQAASVEDIRAAFAQFGPVLDVHTPKEPTTGERKFFAFVTFGTDEARTAAIAAGSVSIGGMDCNIKAASRTRNDGGAGKGGWGKGADWGCWGKGADMWGGSMWGCDPWSAWGGKDAWGKGAKGKDGWGKDSWGKGADSWGYVGGYDAYGAWGKAGGALYGKGDSWGKAGGDPWGKAGGKIGGDSWGKGAAAAGGKGKGDGFAWGQNNGKSSAKGGGYGPAKGGNYGKKGPY